MSREYTKVKHLEASVFEMKAAGHTNAQIAAQLGLTKAQIKGLIKRYNRRAAEEEEAAIQTEAAVQKHTSAQKKAAVQAAAAAAPISPQPARAGIRTEAEQEEEVLRLAQEMGGLEDTLRELGRMWNRIEKSRNALK